MPEYFDRYTNLVGDVELPGAFDNSIEQLENLDLKLLEHNIIGHQVHHLNIIEEKYY